MKRRAGRFILVLVVAVLTAPLSAEAQQAGKIYRIGILDNEASLQAPRLEAFRHELRTLAHGIRRERLDRTDADDRGGGAPYGDGAVPAVCDDDLAQSDLPRDPAILRTAAAAQHNAAHVGIYAAVTRGGRIRRGDQVTVAAKRS